MSNMYGKKYMARQQQKTKKNVKTAFSELYG